MQNPREIIFLHLSIQLTPVPDIATREALVARCIINNQMRGTLALFVQQKLHNSTVSLILIFESYNENNYMGNWGNSKENHCCNKTISNKHVLMGFVYLQISLYTTQLNRIVLHEMKFILKSDRRYFILNTERICRPNQMHSILIQNTISIT